jgi:SNF2 family DNA or RNA helicase
VFEHLSDEEWRECDEFFEIGEDIQPQTLLHFPGLKTAVAPYQLSAAYFNLLRNGIDDNYRGAYLADKMGLGKSIETILSILLIRLVKLSQAEVARSRKTGQSGHNGANVPVGTPCPSRHPITKRSKWPFACPCELRLSADLKLSNGPMLILSPAGLVSNWRGEWIKHVDSTNALNGGMRLLIQGLKPGKETNDNDKLGRHGIFTYTDKHTDELTNVTKENALPTARGNHTVVLMSKNLVANRLHPGLMQDICWAFITLDEAHQSKRPDTKVLAFLFEQPLYTFILFLSATPWDKSPKDIQPPIQIIQRKYHKFITAQNKPSVVLQDKNKTKALSAQALRCGAWNLDNAASHWRTILAASRQPDFDRADPKIEAARKEATIIIQKVLASVMLRRTEKTRWQEMPLVPMPLHDHYDIEVEIEDNTLLSELQDFVTTLEKATLAKLQERWDVRSENREKNIGLRPVSINQNEWLKLMREARFFGCFPQLLSVGITSKMILSKTVNALVENETTEKNSWAYEHLDLIDKSPKMQCLRTILNRLRPGEPFVFFSANPAESFVQYMVCLLLSLWTKAIS